MEFEDFQIGSIGDLMTEDKFGWINLWVSCAQAGAVAIAAIQDRAARV